MFDTTLESFTELSEHEARDIIGGSTPIQYAVFFVACFKAGFYFGYSELGPALFGEK